jgi:o-succinylbenzoate synthase
MALLRVRSSDGLTGLGEAVPLSLRGGESLAEVVAQLEALGEALVEAGSWSASGSKRLAGALTNLSRPAACAVLTARLDLEARERRIPAWRAMGAKRAEPVACNATLPAGDPAETMARAEQWAADGFQAFKLKVGAGSDAGTVKALRAALGPGPRIRLDANGAWDLETAVRTLAECEPFDVELVEQPVESLRDMARLRHSSNIPVAADESVVTAADAERAVAMEACDLATVKLSKVGGHLDALEIAARLPVYLSSALDGPVGIAAAAHLAQVLRERDLDAGVAQGLATSRLFASTVGSCEAELRGAMLHVPDGHGLGVEIDDAALGRHRL